MYEFETSCSDSYIPPACTPAYAPPLCEICQCSDHDSSSCPYYIPSEGLAGISNMIETIEKQRVELEIKMREFDCHVNQTLGLILLSLMFVCVMMVCVFLL